MTRLAPPPSGAISVALHGAGEVPADDRWLGPRERAFAAGLRTPKRRADWRLGRFAAKQALATWRGSDTGCDCEVLPDDRGAPVAWLDGRQLPVALSLSHRAGYGLCVVSPGQDAVGCDIEWIEPRTPEFVADYFTDRERALVAAAPESARPLLANLLWSSKESALKALGLGLTRDTRTLEVHTDVDSGVDAWRPMTVRIANEPVSSLGLKYFGDRTPPLLGWWRRQDALLITVISTAVQTVRA